MRERTPAGDNARSGRTSGPRPPLVIGCGALAEELVQLTRRAGLPPMDLTCLPASLHNRPERIPGAVAARIRRARADGYDRIFVAYADCGTGGVLDRVLDAEGVSRLEGAHCYEVYAGRAAFAALADEEPGTFYLTDFLARNFDRLVVRGLGIDRHPELLPMYFGNYRRLVYLAQTDDDVLTARAKAGAKRLGLAFERRLTGLGELAPAIATFGRGGVATPRPVATGPVATPGAIASQVGVRRGRWRNRLESVVSLHSRRGTDVRGLLAVDSVRGTSGTGARSSLSVELSPARHDATASGSRRYGTDQPSTGGAT